MDSRLVAECSGIETLGRTRLVGRIDPALNGAGQRFDAVLLCRPQQRIGGKFGVVLGLALEIEQPIEPCSM